MLVRSVSSLSAVLLLIAVACPVQADQGLPAQSALSEMGLSGIVVMSDVEAMAIRGLGYKPKYDGHHYDKKSSASAYGHSYATISRGGAYAHSEDGFRSRGRHHASGEHKSYAGIVVKPHKKQPKRGGGESNGGWGGRPMPKPTKVVVFAGGSSYSSTK